MPRGRFYVSKLDFLEDVLFNDPTGDIIESGAVGDPVSRNLKGDDDEYVNPAAVAQYITEHGSSPRTLHGCLQRHSPVMRSTKYRVSKTLYPFDRYPAFLSGGGFLFPGASVKILYEASKAIPVFPLDDVYFGFLALAGDLTYRHDARFHVYGLGYNACKYRQALVVHGIGPERLVTVWNGVQEARCKA